MTRRKGKNAVVILTAQQMEEINKLVQSIKDLIGEHKEIDEELELSSKLNGPLGEAIGLTKLYSIYRSYADYKWRGKCKKGWDVQVTEKGKEPISFQIKTSAQEKYVFRVVKVSNVDSEKVRMERGNKEFIEISEKIKESIDKAQTDVWLLIHAKQSSLNFYWIEKEDLTKVVTEHYKNAVNYRDHTKGKKEFREYVDKNNVYNPILVEKAQTDVDLLNKYNRINIICGN